MDKLLELLNEDVYEGLKIYFQEKNINYMREL